MKKKEGKRVLYNFTLNAIRQIQSIVASINTSYTIKSLIVQINAISLSLFHVLFFFFFLQNLTSRRKRKVSSTVKDATQSPCFESPGFVCLYTLCAPVCTMLLNPTPTNVGGNFTKVILLPTGY